MDEYIGIVKLFAGNYPIRGWAFCAGQLLPISQYSALFSILGTTYGGNGTTTFALPDLRGRAAISFGAGPGLQNYTQGETGGTESVTLIATQMPSHSHALNGTTAVGDLVPPTGALLAAAKGEDSEGNPITVSSYVNGAANTMLNPASIGITGGSQPHENRPPFLTLNYIICLEGIYPPRD